MLAISRAIDKMNTFIGRVVSWGILAAILISTLNAIIRKVFNVSSNAWLELQWLLFGAVFMICSAWTLVQNEHIRIDIVSNLLPKSVRTTIEFIGHILFLLPMAAVMVWLTWPYFIQSMMTNEQSTNAGGVRSSSKTQPAGRLATSWTTASATSSGVCMRPIRFCAAIAANAASAVVLPRAAIAAAAPRVIAVSTKPGQTA